MAFSDMQQQFSVGLAWVQGTGVIGATLPMWDRWAMGT